MRLKCLAIGISVALAFAPCQCYASFTRMAGAGPRSVHRLCELDGAFVSSLRGGAVPINFQKTTIISDFMQNIASKINLSPSVVYNGSTIFLVVVSLLSRLTDKGAHSGQLPVERPREVKSLQSRFLLAFWLLRLADWLQGPYFYEVYSSKLIGGSVATLEFVSRLFLIGFASTGLFGPLIGRWVDIAGRRNGTLLYTILYSLGAWSTTSNNPLVLVAGRFLNGLGTALLFSAPEAWLVEEHNKLPSGQGWLGDSFSLAYAGDALVAIAAGHLATWSTQHLSPGLSTGPFIMSIGVLIAAAAVICLTWSENKSSALENDNVSSGSQRRGQMKDVFALLAKDRRIWLVGVVQALFESAMYMFVLQWPPALKAAITQFDPAGTVPYGSAFSMFMASCLVGSTVFGKLRSKYKSSISLSTSTVLMLSLATFAMLLTRTIGLQHWLPLSLSFMLFEMCVGMYFPTIGSLRAQYLPDAHRGLLTTLFGLPLNLLVVAVFLNIKRLGTRGTFTCASLALFGATVCAYFLRQSGIQSHEQR